MRPEVQSVHEPEAELSSAEEVLEDADVMRAYLSRKRLLQSGQSVGLRVPLWVVIEAVDQMEESALRQMARHIERRLAAG